MITRSRVPMRLSFNLFFLCLMTTGILFQACRPDGEQNKIPVVKTTSGEISGIYEDSVSVFKGIPYAKAERFMPPQDPDKWDGVRPCSTYGPVAKQVVGWINDSLMNERDLFSLNVWTQGRA